jgi:FtsP/CotA-like multicopper oxidase with cupredoxin domain
MHLHGHDFRVLNGQGEYAPMKNIIDMMPMETDTLNLQPRNPAVTGFSIATFYIT